MTRGRRALAVAAAVVVTTLVAGVVSMFVRWGPHAGRDAVESARLAALGRVRMLERAPGGPLRSEQSKAVVLDLRSGERVVVSAFRYRSTSAATARAWLLSPRWNSLTWDLPQRLTPDERSEWRLPGRARLVGFMCVRRRCDRWLLWWPRSADIVLVDLRGPGFRDADAAVVMLRPVWNALA